MSESPAIPLLEAGFFYAVFSWIPEKRSCNDFKTTHPSHGHKKGVLTDFVMWQITFQ